MSTIRNADLAAMGNANVQVQIVDQMRAARDASLNRVTNLYHPDGNANSLASPDSIGFLTKEAQSAFGGKGAANATTPAAGATSTAGNLAQVNNVNNGGTQFNVNNTVNNFFGSGQATTQKLGCCCPHEAPKPEQNGGLKVDDKGVITTPGGYKIEATKQHEWTVTGPDGKSTRIWGDPHVDEGDGGKWDFKRDSTFVLADGTKIDCKTKPWGDGSMTVTDSLSITSGNDRVQVTGIGEGKGKVGEVTADGHANVNSFGGKDVFVMGKETDDWSHQGKEVIGSENGGETFKLGNELEAGVVKPLVENAKPAQTGKESMDKLFGALSKIFDGLKEFLSAKKPEEAKPAPAPVEKPVDADPMAKFADTLKAIATMFQRLAELLDLQSQVKARPVQS